MTDGDRIEAAGGVVTRVREGRLEVLVVHRPKYADWSFPKGKLDPGEQGRDAARREVLEETGYRCTLGERLPSIRYADRSGRGKRVRYWLMEVESGSFTPNREVDAIEWLTVDDAVGRLTYPHDRELLYNTLLQAQGPQPD